MDNTQSNFDQAYWASQPPEVRALAAINDPGQRTAQGAQLATNGFTIDVPIMVWGWDPYLLMQLRQQFGYTWVPSALQPNVTIAPSLSQPGVVPYDPLHPPPGSILVSTNIADFPPFQPPTPAPVPLITDLVGPQAVGTMYLTVTGDLSPDGTQWTDVRGRFVKHVFLTPFGREAYWEKIA
jgi:hypothetical protein